MPLRILRPVGQAHPSQREYTAPADELGPQDPQWHSSFVSTSRDFLGLEILSVESEVSGVYINRGGAKG
jgi:hypothetical protein